ncbi:MULTISPECIES: hypothetical protein [Caldimonas]|jgi:hypothetical protein|uniref:SCO family protein n=1 Tax=Caldimonas TaxID=196013 RepID=UPI00036470D5|nr:MULTISPECIES: hypothetical protein [Caldimonas]GIX23313.1 MAG: cytochrome c oxidase subunit I [Caldimonas sp.]
MSGSKSSVPGADAAEATVAARELEPLSFTVHSMPRPGLDERKRLGRLKMLLVLLVCAAPVIASYFTYYVIRPEGRTNYGHLIDPQRPLPALNLRDLHGQPVAADSLRHQWLIVVVGSSACNAVCERNLYLQRQLREMTGKDRDRIDKVWLVTDEAPIAPALLQAIAGAQVLRASREEVAAWLEPEAGHALEDHLYLVDPLGHWMMRFPAQADPARVKRDLTRLLNASQHWDRAGR